MRTRQRALRVAIALAAIATTALTAIGLTSASGATTTGVPAPYVSKTNFSDPHTKPCTVGGQAGICLFVSQDRDEGSVSTGYPAGQANSYPMTTTFGWFSTDGINWQGPTTLMTEAAYQGKGWVQNTFNGSPFNPKHLWAPSAQQGTDGNWYLYVPDISDAMHPATSSFIGVSKSTTGPMGSYTPVGKVNISDYASDPDVVDTRSGRFGTGPDLYWADGDGSNCGGISMAHLDQTDMTTITSTPTRVTFSGIPAAWGWCVDRFGRAHPYMEGPHVYNTSLGGPGSPGAASGNWPAGTPGPYLMVVPVKPAEGHTPAECANSGQGQPGTANELIAWFTQSATVADQWDYRGVLMCGSAKEYTDQGSIVPVTTSSRTNGASPLLFVYHDGASSSVPGHHRTVHAECLFFGNGSLANSIRTGGTQFTDSGAESDCLLGGPNTSTMALKSPVTGKFLSQNGNNTLTANRYAVGPWERFSSYCSPGACPISATVGANGARTFNGAAWGSNVSGLATVTSTTSAITSSSGTGNSILFNLTFNGPLLSMTSVQTGKGVRTLSDGTLRADTTTPETYTIYHQ